VDYLKVLSQYSPGEAEEIHGRLKAKYLLSQYAFGENNYKT
jgi:hypothetical protein